jgi:hypothetical protein
LNNENTRGAPNGNAEGYDTGRPEPLESFTKNGAAMQQAQWLRGNNNAERNPAHETRPAGRSRVSAVPAARPG